MLDFFVNMGGALLGAGIINLLINMHNEKNKNKIDYTALQMKNLYGPLYFACIQQSIYVKNADNADVFIGIPEDSNDTSLGQEYIKGGAKLNSKIFDILQSESHYLDIDDMPIIDDFIENYQILEMVRNTADNDLLQLPLLEEYEDYWLFIPHFCNHMIDKFQHKQKYIRNWVGASKL